MKLEYKIKFDELDWISAGDEIRYKCYQHEGFQVRLVEFGKEMVHPDWCLKGHFAYVIEGKLELVFEEVKKLYDPGDVFFIPDGEAHKHRPRVLTDKVVFFSVEKYS